MSTGEISTKPPRRFLLILLAAVGAVALVALVGWVQLRHGNASVAAAEEKGEGQEPQGIAQATIIPVATRAMRETVDLLGITEPEPNAVSAVSPIVSGRILRLPVREGDRIRAGQVVAVLDPGETPAQLAQATAQVETALADARQAKTAVEQEKTRVAIDRRQAESALTAARAQVGRVAGELRAMQAANQAELAKAQAALATAQRDLERVRAGSRPQEVAAARAALAEVDAQRQNALAQEKRMNRLYEEQVASQKQLEDAQAQSRVAEAQYQAALQRARLAEEGARKEEIAVAEARVREAESGLHAAEAGQLTEAGKREEITAAKAQVETAVAALDKAHAGARDVTAREQQRQRAEAQLRQARGAFQQTQARSHFLTVTAPVSGVVTRRAANEGDTAQPGAVLLEIAQPGRVRFRIAAPTTRLASLRPGQSAEIRFDSLDAGAYPARVAVVGQGADGSGNGVAWLAIAGVAALPRLALGAWRLAPNRVQPRTEGPRGSPGSSGSEPSAKRQAPSAALRPGLSGKARIILRQEPAALAVPASALVEEEGGDALVVVGPDNVAQRRKVQVGLREGDWVEIRRGVRAGERVATVGAFEIENGMKVRDH